MNGAEVIVDTLREQGVQVVFGLPGVHNLALWEALSRSDIRLVGVRHEQAAAYAADGYARATGRLGVAITTTGPGAANTLGAVGEAWASRSPILVIATDIATTLRRPGVYRGVLHETVGQQDLFRPVTKAVFVVDAMHELRATVGAAATAAAAAPRRPTYLQVPTDLLAATFDAQRQSVARVAEPVGAGEHAQHVAVLAAARRPLLWVGGGAIDAAAQVAAVAERLGAPVITTYMARGLLGPDHPLAVGLPPHLSECGQLWDDADVVLAVGTDFDGMMTQNWAQPAPARMVRIALEPQPNYPEDLVITGDAAAVLAALLPELPHHQPWADLEGARSSARAAAVADQPEATAMLDVLARVLPDEAVVVADMCIPGYWYAALGRVGGPRRLAYPVGWGTLGFGFPASLGTAAAAALGQLAGPVVCLCGDGGFLFAAGELATFAQEQLPVTVVLVDDGGYGMLRYDQKHAGQQVYGTELLTPDFAALAASFGVRAQTVEGFGAAFETALAGQVADPVPTMLVVRARLDPPPTTSPRWYRRRPVPAS
jgi:thiamine pyrophosphate-dependent acetolactate synthase large subunit-like protein